MTSIRQRAASLSERHQEIFRDPREIVGQGVLGAETDPALLRCRVRGRFWETLDRCGVKLIVTREYEHCVLMLGGVGGVPEMSSMPLPHPSGVAVDRGRGQVAIASTRNPNQIYTFEACSGWVDREEARGGNKRTASHRRVLVPVKTDFYPGSLYLHDVVSVAGTLYATAAGHNAVIEILPNGRYRYAWWPKVMDRGGRPRRPRTEANYLQLNSIAAGATLGASFFTASTDRIVSPRIGDPAFVADRQGVVFSGASRAPVCRGLTRPHSARLYRGRLWVANSGYGELGYVDGERFRPVARLGGWTRGLCIRRGCAFVGISRILPRFERYAPGLDVNTCRCGVSAVDLRTGEVLGLLEWPLGNQIFAVEWVDQDFSDGFLNVGPAKADSRGVKDVFYTFQLKKDG